MQVVDYTCRKRRKREKHQIAMVDKGETLPGDITVWVESLHIPPVPPTGLSRSRLIDINYELVVSIYLWFYRFLMHRTGNFVIVSEGFGLN